MSEKKKENVLPVAEQKQTPAKPDISAIFNITPEKIKQAEELGIPIGQLIEWIKTVEYRFVIMEQEMPQKIVDKFQEVAKKREQKRIEYLQNNPQQQPPSGGDGITKKDIISFINAGEQSGGDKMQQLMYQKALTGMDLQNALTRAFVIRLAPELADEVSKDIFKRTAPPKT